MAKLDRGGKKGSGSGGNNVPLGKMRILGEKRGNEDEIQLDMDDEDEGADGPRYMDTSLPAPAEVVASEVSPEEAAEMQARIDAILASIGSEPDPTVDDDANTRMSTLPPPPPGLPQRPAFTATSDTEFMQGASRGRAFSDATSTSSRGGRGRGRGGGGGARERGEYNEKWYEGYYDPTFNENPWAKLEKEKGLPSIGTFLENQPRRGGRGMA